MRTQSPTSPLRGRSQGTTMMEVLVVIVIFLVGILAIVQIFPRGFQILLTTRNNSVASALARDEVERIKSRTDQLAEMIVPVLPVGGAYVVDPTFNPDRLGPMGDTLAADGSLSLGGNLLGDWELFSGPNTIRRVIGEGGAVPAPRQVGTNASWFGGLMVVQFGPLAFNAPQNNVDVYGNDLAGNMRPEDPLERWGDGEYFVANPNSAAITLRLPSGPTDRAYKISLSAYTTGGEKRDYVSLPMIVVPASVANPMTGQHPLYGVVVDSHMIGLQKWVPDNIASVDVNTLRVRRAYLQLALATPFSNDPYEYKLLDNRVGVLLFNPIAASVYLNKPSGREPLLAKVDYDVYDWRILRDDFRLTPSAGTQQYKLSLGSLLVGTDLGVDGQTAGPITILETAPSDPAYTDDSPANDARADNFVIVDMDTGGIFMERLASDPSPSPSPLIVINKSNGLITFRDSDGDPSNGTTGKLLLPDKTVRDTTLENRVLRALYRTKNEFSVQVLKAADRYTSSATAILGVGQYFVGAGSRVYFPKMDAGRKVNVGEINYVAGGVVKQILGHDFIIRTSPAEPLPYIDIQEVDSAASTFSLLNGAAVKGVRGASIAVRVLWNPESFTLGADTIQNMNNLERFGQAWRKSTNETYLQRGEVAR